MYKLICGGVKKYIVLKIEDVKRLHPGIQEALMDICHCAEHVREVSGKYPSPEYIVVNTDEPYANEVIDVLKRHGVWGERKVGAEK